MKTVMIDALIVAAGCGTRIGSDLPKQYQLLGGKAVLRRAVEIYHAHPGVRHVQVVIGAEHEKFYAAAMGELAAELPTPVIGGRRRQDSVHAGLAAMTAEAPGYVLIADAARPFTSHALIDEAIAALANDTSVLVAAQLTDTLKLQDGTGMKTIARENHWLAQTPQGFPFEKILELHQAMKNQNFTDDIALFEAAGLPVRIVTGNAQNMKITTPEDFKMAEALLNVQTEMRVGHGIDVHRFMDGDHVWLGGVRVPHSRGVEAHSDGDVVLHALTDALLGAIGAGDIGQHFPPSDPKWRGASSDQFVRTAMDFLRERGGHVINADITVLCESPRIGPHRDAMRARVAELLGVDETRVNIKATTTEKLGALGRAEGLAAEAVIVIQI